MAASRFLLVLFVSFVTPAVMAANFWTGSKEAKVQVLIFGDYECPYTKRVSEHVEMMQKDFGDQIGVSLAHFPLDFHPHARKAAIAAVCAGHAGKFAEFSKVIFSNQRILTEDSYSEIASDLGIPDETFAPCLNSEEASLRVQQDILMGRALSIDGTPTTYINGEQIVGAYPYEQFKAALERKLAETETAPSHP